jgi:hypothetical protein
MKGWTLDDFKQSEAAKKPENAHIFGTKPEKKKKGSKYNNKPTEVNGINFQSTKEAKYYKTLLWRLKLGEIGLLELQKPYLLIEANEKEKKMQYFADFVWIETATGKTVVCDTKGVKTPDYIIKRKLMKEKLGIEIFEV